MRSLLAASKRWKWIALAAAIGAVGAGFAVPASAHDSSNHYDEFSHRRFVGPDRHYDRHYHGRRHHGYHRHYVRPPVRYYQVPPPAYYRPYYDSGVSLNFNLR